MPRACSSGRTALGSARPVPRLLQRLARVLAGLVLAGAVVLLRADTTPTRPDRRARRRGCTSASSTTRRSAGSPSASRTSTARGRRGDGRALDRELVGRGAGQAAPRRRRLRARVPPRRRRRVRAQRGAARDRGAAHDLGHAGWANGGARPNVAPSDPRDLRDFAHALAARYSGRKPGYPFVRFYTVWNEPNGGQFLSPQFDDAAGRWRRGTTPRWGRPSTRGMKSVSPHAHVAAGETAPRGRDEPCRTCRAPRRPRASPGRRPGRAKLRFDAWATIRIRATTSPIPTRRNRGPRLGSPGSAASTRARALVRPRVGAALGDGVRVSDEPADLGAAPFPLQAD